MLNIFMRIDLSNKTAVVFGGSRGIGLEVVGMLNAAGAETFVASRSNGVDVTDEKQITNFLNQFEKIDILINVAAINYCKTIESIEISEWDEVLATNLRSVYLTIKHSIPKMSRGSKIVNVSSIAGRNRSIVSGSHYTASKAGIIGLTRQMAYELGPKGINVNCTCPSQTMTDMLRESMSENELSQLSESIPLRRLATVEEQAGPVLFLCSKMSDYMTGSILDVNGGQL